MNGRRKPNMAPCQTPMAEQPMPERLFNFDEVALGYTPEQAMAEAEPTVPPTPTSRSLSPRSGRAGLRRLGSCCGGRTP